MKCPKCGTELVGDFENGFTCLDPTCELSRNKYPGFTIFLYKTSGE